MKLLRDDLALGTPDLVPARMLNALVYCPRLFHLEWVQCEWRESEDTLAGSREHKRVDRESGSLPAPEELAGSGFTARALTLSSPEERLIARLDLLEGKNGEVVPVDYKHGHAPEGPDAAWDSDRVQLGVQALLLRQHGYRCERAVVWYAGSRRRVEVRVDEVLLHEVRAIRDRALAVAAQPEPPPPLIDSPKCPRCSLVGICLPDEDNHITGRADPEPRDVRRLYPARDDALPVYVQAQGARVGKRGDELEIWERDRGSRRVRLIDVSSLALFGNVTVTASALSELLRRGIPICHHSYGGWFRGVTTGLGSRNCMLRIEQFRVADDPARSLSLAQGFIARKILNCRTLLRRNGNDVDPGVLDELGRCAAQAARVENLASLLGVEGAAARVYFGSFSRMIKQEHNGMAEFDFQKRSRRPPMDPVNALLSLAYSALSRDWTVALVAVGLDPYSGFLHQPRFGRPALALDMMEEFRPLIADSVVLQVINNGEVRPKDFIRRGNAVNLTEEGRKRFFLGYERRMGHLVRHPMFGYRVSYRRLLEVQARLLGRYLTRELPTYDGFRTR